MGIPLISAMYIAVYIDTGEVVENVGSYIINQLARCDNHGIFGYSPNLSKGFLIVFMD